MKKLDYIFDEEGTFNKVGDQIQTLRFKKGWLNRGFTQIPNQLLSDTSISIGARLLYFLLMRRVFQKDFCYPGIETLQKELGVVEDTFYSYKKELEEKGWIEVKRRGQGKTNIYLLLKYD